MSDAPYRILGSLGSPYTLKMRAILRYRRIPHIWVQSRPENDGERTAVKVAIIPIIRFPNGIDRVDSTPMLYALEARHSGRSIVPADPAAAFLAYLLEDMADEWGTKLMFHYRWHRTRDQEQMSRWLAFDRLSGRGRSAIIEYAERFRERQTSRMPIVGCTEQNAPIIEASAKRLLAIFEKHVVDHDYLFGSRPSLADFGWYGQLSQLIVDPTPSDLLRSEAPFTMRWIMQLDDASGIEGEWDDELAPAIEDLLAFAGDTYFPFLLANADALAQGAETFTVDLLGGPYTQGVFKYQAKCLSQLRAAFAALPSAVRDRLRPLLERTGCLAPLDAAALHEAAPTSKDSR